VSRFGPEVERFRVDVPEQELEDLRNRLRTTRFPAQLGDERYGIAPGYVRELVEYWAEEFDWYALQERINAYDHYRTVVDGVPVHFLHRPGVGPDPVPVILTHGWPWTFWHWSKVIEPLADPAAHGGDPSQAFELIIPSYPGFAFSSPLPEHSDLNFWKVGDLWHRLMHDVLGFERYGAGGGDFGALVTGHMGHKYADHVQAIHVSTPTPLDIFQGERWWDITEGRVSAPDAGDLVRDGFQRYMRKFVAHIAVHMLDPQTLSYGLTDSPAALLAWIVRRYQLWVDHDGDLESVFPKDDLLGMVTLFWVTRTAGTSLLPYVNTALHPWQPSHDRHPQIEAPAGVTFMGFENPPGVSGEARVKAFAEASATRSPSDRSARWYNLVNATAHDRGGHFAPWENPEAWVGDMRETFRRAGVNGTGATA
jgi:microsomal epoxide hydrolase